MAARAVDEQRLHVLLERAQDRVGALDRVPRLQRQQRLGRPHRARIVGDDLPGTAVVEEERHVHRDPQLRPLHVIECEALQRQAAVGHQAVPDRRLALEGFALDDVQWAELRIPVDMAFFFHDSGPGKVVAYYPSPMGPTESLLSLEAWDAIEGANPILRTLEQDVEALLVDRSRGHRCLLYTSDAA